MLLKYIFGTKFFRGPNRDNLVGIATEYGQYVFMAWCLVKHRGNFTFNFLSLIVQRTIF